eukprot:209058-Pelagomonas_calceolata.AAC.2
MSAGQTCTAALLLHDGGQLASTKQPAAVTPVCPLLVDSSILPRSGTRTPQASWAVKGLQALSLS